MNSAALILSGLLFVWVSFGASDGVLATTDGLDSEAEGLQLRPLSEGMISESTRQFVQSQTSSGFRDPQVAINLKSRDVVFKVRIENGSMIEEVRLTGQLAKDWTAYLYDGQPKRGWQRLKATAVCLDYERCEYVSLNVFYKVRGHLRLKQFNTPMPDSLVENGEDEDKGEDVLALEHGEGEPPEGADELNDGVGEFVGVRPQNPRFYADLWSYQFTFPDEGKSGDLVLLPRSHQADSLSPFGLDEDSVFGPLSHFELPGFMVPEAFRPSSMISGFGFEPFKLKVDLINGGQAVGYVTRGQILKSSELSVGGSGFEKVNVSARHQFGSGMLVDFIEKVSQEFTRVHPHTKLYINAMSKKGGGRLSSHRSHQSGLDMDVAFLPGEASFPSHLVKGRVKPDFKYQENFEFFALAVSTGLVDRIFVNRVIKKGFCDWGKKNGYLKEKSYGEVFKRIRPYSGHFKHFHLRLKCSSHYARCFNRAEVKGGTGC